MPRSIAGVFFGAYPAAGLCHGNSCSGNTGLIRQYRLAKAGPAPVAAKPCVFKLLNYRAFFNSYSY
jgi:hypothetical protein